MLSTTIDQRRNQGPIKPSTLYLSLYIYASAKRFESPAFPPRNRTISAHEGTESIAISLIDALQDKNKRATKKSACLQNLIYFNFVGHIYPVCISRITVTAQTTGRHSPFNGTQTIASSLPPRRARQRPSVKTRPPKCHSKDPGAFPAEHRTCGGHQASPCATQTRNISLRCPHLGFDIIPAEF
ncbi:hypothetical protein NPIL_409171 [Nephila pilipes]|uniref:Uncharacterized protein n=1 Tax=Nephila pilipes TaxID=299642 RepID=A0A8X6QNM1_NEPPI|nr:hypothetical protein NPIL_409171 [Nephila pilipes]